MTVSVTLQFSSLTAAAHALTRLSDEPVSGTTVAPSRGVIAHADRPDVGGQAPLPPLDVPLALAPVVDPVLAQAAAVFGAAQTAPPEVAVVPAAPPAPLAPAAPTPHSAATAPTAAPGGAELDSAGLPWDARIHAGTKTKTKEQRWTAKRNVPDAFRAQVEALLRATPTAPVAVPAAPVAVPAALAAPVASVAPEQPAPAIPVAPEQPAPAPVAPAAAAPAGETFAAYMGRIGAAFTARPVDAHAAMVAALAPFGLTSVGQLAGNAHLIPAVDAAFQAALA